MGRSAELAGLARALDEARLVTVTGVGKSRLAMRAATARPAPRDGVWRVELAPVHDPEFVDYAVGEALGLTDHTTRLPRETLCEYLAGRQLLLVLDGFEHLVDACAALVAELLRRAPSLQVLSVGRQPLAPVGERLFPLGPLGVDEAVELFMDRASRQGLDESGPAGSLQCGSAHYNAPHELCEAAAGRRSGTSGTRGACGRGRSSTGRRRWRGRWDGTRNGHRRPCRRRAGRCSTPWSRPECANPPPRPPGGAGRRRAEVLRLGWGQRA